jgi:putative transcriptional regulator
MSSSPSADRSNRGTLAPALLLSMPQLADPNFHKTVVLLCTHGEEGAFGLVLNRPLLTTGRVVVNLDPPVTTDHELQVWIGGPVEQHRSWMLVADDPGPGASGGVQIAPDVHLSTAPDLLQRLLARDPPPRARLIVGYAGWGPGQLEAELSESSWLLSDVTSDIIFDTAPEQMWERAIRRLGADPASLHSSRGVH